MELDKIYGLENPEYFKYYNENVKMSNSKLYYKLLSTPDSEQSADVFGIVLDSPSPKNLRNLGFERRDIGKGILIDKWDDVIEFSFSKNDDRYKIYDKLDNSLGMDIVSEKFKNILEKNNIKGIQFLPLKSIKDLDNNIYLEKYYYMNVTNILPTKVLDLEKSRYYYSEVRGEIILNVDFPCLKINDVEDNDIFRVKINKYNNTPVYFSQKIVNLIKDNNLTGFDFYNISHVRVSI